MHRRLRGMTTRTCAAGVAALALTVLAGCSDTSELAKACKLDPEPAATGLPPKRDPPVAWLGPQHKALRFHSFKRLGAQVAVSYGDPAPIDRCSTSEWGFPLQVTTFSRRATTRRRLERSLGVGVPDRLGTRFGCRRRGGPDRVAVLTRNSRVESLDRCAQTCCAQLKPCASAKGTSFALARLSRAPTMQTAGRLEASSPANDAARFACPGSSPASRRDASWQQT